MADLLRSSRPAPSDTAVAFARAHIAHAARESGVLLAGLRVRITEPGTHHYGTVVAQANAYADGHLIRVQVTANTVDLAASLLIDHAERRLRESAHGWSPRPWTGPALLAEPAGRSGEITRIKTVTPAKHPVQVAAATMDTLDYDAHLFLDADTGQHAAVYRGAPTGYRLIRLTVAEPPHARGLPLVADPRPAPRLLASQAAERLHSDTLPYLFFAALPAGSGALIYRRHDGNYTLITTTAA